MLACGNVHSSRAKLDWLPDDNETLYEEVEMTWVSYK